MTATTIPATPGWFSHALETSNPSNPIGEPKPVIAWSIDDTTNIPTPITTTGPAPNTALSNGSKYYLADILSNAHHGEAIGLINAAVNAGTLS